MNSVLTFLDDFRRHPGGFVGGTDPRVWLVTLESMLAGYDIALRNHEIEEVPRSFNWEFGEFLRHTRRWSVSSGAIFRILHEASSGEAAWEMFWQLVEEFRGTLPKAVPGEA